MKTSKDILEVLVKRHSFSSLSKYICYSQFLKFLPPRFQKAIAFVTLKNSQLRIAIKHPGYKMELDYNKEVIKTLLTTFATTKEGCEFLKDVTSISFFISTDNKPKNETKNLSIPYPPEIANGNFDIDVKDKDIKKLLEEIKVIIKESK
jgi:hypothetical protein